MTVFGRTIFACAALALAAAAPAHASGLNGTAINGASMNGLTMNGAAMNGFNNGYGLFLWDNGLPSFWIAHTTSGLEGIATSPFKISLGRSGKLISRQVPTT